MREWAHWCALVLALAVSIGVAFRSPKNTGAVLTMPHSVVDATGVVIAPRSTQRIVSLSILSDRLLVRLIPSDRLIAASTWSTGSWSLPLTNTPRLSGSESVEAIVTLRPDVVITAGFATDAVVRLREHGIPVYCMGDLNGWDTCVRVLADLGQLVQAESRSAALTSELLGQVRVLQLAAPARPERAVCCSVIDSRIFGGTRGTAYHDVLTMAGCVDAAAERYSGWPTWTMEDMLRLQPDVIVMGVGGAAALRQLPGVDQLTARIIELPRDMIDDPGLGIINAAMALRAELSKK